MAIASILGYSALELRNKFFCRSDGYHYLRPETRFASFREQELGFKVLLHEAHKERPYEMKTLAHISAARSADVEVNFYVEPDCRATPVGVQFGIYTHSRTEYIGKRVTDVYDELMKPWKIPPIARARVNGNEVKATFRLSAGDSLIFYKPKNI